MWCVAKSWTEVAALGVTHDKVALCFFGNGNKMATFQARYTRCIASSNSSIRVYSCYARDAVGFQNKIHRLANMIKFCVSFVCAASQLN